MSSRVTVGKVIMVVDMGIKGCPKHTIDRADLLQPAPQLTKKRELNVSRAAKQLAAKHGLDLSQIKGTGRGGQITLPDVKAAIG